jgi:hypothetical protein
VEGRSLVLLSGGGGGDAFPGNVKNQDSALCAGESKSAGRNAVNGRELAGHTAMSGT